MDKTVIDIKNLHKTFKIHTDEKKTARELFTSFFKRGNVKKFHVLNDINLEIKQGEFVGIIGRNGSGKSTLLKIISQIYTPDKGSTVSISGKIVPFLELGVGFNHDLTGRENIFLNGTILGMSKKDLEKRFKPIVRFAELEDFIDEPVKNYSSGMMLRLAFSIAIQVEADIYILDEILAVGDENFQRKSINIIQKLKRQGKTILFVSHSMDAIQQYCTRAILLSNSKLIIDGKPNEVIETYRKINDDIAKKEVEKQEEERKKKEIKRVGDRKVEITKVELLDINGKETALLTDKGTLTVRMHYVINNKKYMLEELLFGVSIFRDDETYITGTNTKNYSLPIKGHKSGVVDYIIDTKYLIDGNYLITAAVFEYETVHHLDFHSRMYPLEVRLYNDDQGALSIPAEWKFKLKDSKVNKYTSSAGL